MAIKLGMVGLGLMGTAMSTRFLEEGFEVRGYDIEAERVRELEGRGGRAVSSPAEAARGADFVVVSLLYSEVVREVCLDPGGIAGGAGEGLVVIDTSTARPEDSAATAAALRERGVEFLDASLSGTSSDVREKNIVAMVGGGEEAFQRARPVLDAIARSVYHLGPNGAGARTKLIVNLVLGLNRLALAEGLVMGMKADTDLPVLLTVLKDSAAYSRAMDQRGERMVTADYEEPLSRVRQHHKDVRLMLEQGQKLGAPTLLSLIHQQVLQAAEMGGLADADTSAIIEILRRMAGIPSR